MIIIKVDEIINNNINLDDDDLLLNISNISNDSDLLNEIERVGLELVSQNILERAYNQIGDWLLVKYNKKIVHYVGLVHDIQQEIYKLKFLKLKMENKNSTYFIIPNYDDIDEIDGNSIICRLPEPSIGRRGEFVLAVNFIDYNMAK